MENPYLTAKENRFITLLTVYCRTNFLIICKALASLDLFVESVVAPPKI